MTLREILEVFKNNPDREFTGEDITKLGFDINNTWNKLGILCKQGYIKRLGDEPDDKFRFKLRS